MYGSAKMTDRNWEVWDDNRVDHVLKEWGLPMRPRGRQSIVFRNIIKLMEGTTVLDVGCGMGHLYGFLKKHMSHIIYHGVDSSPSMIRKAKESFPEESQDRFKLGDIYNLSGAPRSDSVFSINVLIHLPDPLDEPIKQLWQYVDKCLIIAVRLGNVKRMKRIRYGNRALILRLDTPAFFYQQLGALPNVGKIECVRFDARTSFFKVTKGIQKLRTYKDE